MAAKKAGSSITYFKFMENHFYNNHFCEITLQKEDSLIFSYSILQCLKQFSHFFSLDVNTIMWSSTEFGVQSLIHPLSLNLSHKHHNFYWLIHKYIIIIYDTPYWKVCSFEILLRNFAEVNKPKICVLSLVLAYKTMKQ